MAAHLDRVDEIIYDLVEDASGAELRDKREAVKGRLKTALYARNFTDEPQLVELLKLLYFQSDYDAYVAERYVGMLIDTFRSD